MINTSHNIGQIEQEIMLGYEVNETAKHELLNLLMLAREMRADRALVIDRQKNVSYCVEDIRYVPLIRELAILISQIPDNISDRVRLLAINYLKVLYTETDMTIINITRE